MTQSKPQLSDEQRAHVKELAKMAVRDMLRNREELQDKAATMRAVWNALVECPQWSIVQSDKPAGFQSFDELWSMTPTVKKQ